MTAMCVRRRVLLAAGPGADEPIRKLFNQNPLECWEPVEAESFAQARFILQHSPCDIVLVHEDLVQREGAQALGWLARQPEVPVVFLSSYRPDIMTQAFRQGVVLCLPRELSPAHTPLLAAALDRAAQLGEWCRNQRRSHEQLFHCRRHIDRLVHLIWRTAPMEPNSQWFTQRYAMERLEEEISRTKRHGSPLTLAVAEVEAEEPEEEDKPLDAWTSTVISGSKRRCDVAGQYGMQGFMLLMVHTPKNGGLICCRRLKQLLEAAAAEADAGPRGPIRAYFGLASSSAEADTPQGLLRCAEQNLEAARAGKNDGVVAE